MPGLTRVICQLVQSTAKSQSFLQEVQERVTIGPILSFPLPTGAAASKRQSGVVGWWRTGGFRRERGTHNGSPQACSSDFFGKKSSDKRGRVTVVRGDRIWHTPLLLDLPPPTVALLCFFPLSIQFYSLPAPVLLLPTNPPVPVYLLRQVASALMMPASKKVSAFLREL